MSNLDFLKQYRLRSETDLRERDKMKHFFFPLLKRDIIELENKINTLIPKELEELYLSVGYGFFHNGYKSDFNRLLPPDIVGLIMLREEQYEFDPDLEIYDDPDQLIFFEINEGLYLTVNLTNKQDKSPVYYFEDQISDSIETFLRELDANPEYLRQFDEG